MDNEGKYLSEIVNQRMSGILCHITSLPSQFGVGDLGPPSYEFIDYLSRSNQKIWQMLPLGPIGYGNSPYSSFSAFAGNPLLISPDKLIEQGYLKRADLPYMDFSNKWVEFDKVISFKDEILHLAYQTFKLKQKNNTEKYKSFVSRSYDWLEDYALYRTIKSKFEEKSWVEWSEGLKIRNPEEVEKIKIEEKDKISYYYFEQFIFDLQWNDLRKYAADKSILIMGDLPIYVSHDSTDVWKSPELFSLKADGDLEYASGVPPDPLFPNGQRWGTPIYKWETMKENGFKWWKTIFKQLLARYDFFRIDHFVGFANHYRIRGDNETADGGEWVDTPGKELFLAMYKEFGPLPIIIEDLGLITQRVIELRSHFQFPQMKLLYSGFRSIENWDPEDEFLPHNYGTKALVYTSTHDSSTGLGWYLSISDEVKDGFHEYLGCTPENFHWTYLKLCWRSSSNIAMAQMQDVLGLDDEARMNYPGTVGNHNWRWRFTYSDFSEKCNMKLKDITILYNR